MPTARIHIVPIWKTAPFIRLVVPLVCGILISHYFSRFAGWWLPGMGVTLIFFLLAHFKAFKFPVVYGVSLFWLWVAIGGFLYQSGRIADRENFIGKKYHPGSLVTATLTTHPEPKPNSFRAEATLRQYDSVTKKWMPLDGSIILYFSRDSSLPVMEPGTKIAFTKWLQPIRNSGNPGGFDYKSYAAANGWFYQVYLKNSEYVLADEKVDPGWRIWPIKARSKLLNTLRKYIPDKMTLGVSEALLTGYRNDMDKELAWQYAGTGVAHIIAISGLHLGMIQVALLALFSPMRKIKYGKRLVPLLVIICLWIFAFVTGAGPSVLRSALMFSILLFGKIIGRNGNAYNSLAASAFFLLLFNPGLIFNVGFQLSYSAVLSIFIFSAPIGQWIKTGSRFINKGWQMLSVTLAAQILTLPFVVYYFNQFPVYFLLANLVAVPLTWLALNLSLLLTLVFWWAPPIAKILGAAIDITIATMNHFIAWIHHLPMARIENISLSIPQAIWLMLVIALIAAWLLLRNKISGILAIAGILLFAINREIIWQQKGRQAKLIIYNISRYSAVDIIKGHQVAFWGDTVFLNNPTLYRMNLLPSRILHQVSIATMLPNDTAAFQLLKIGDKKLLILDKDIDTRQSDTLSVDMVLIAANVKARPEWILEKIRCREIIADAKLPFYRVAQWQIAADSLHLRFHSVAEKGAFVLDFKN
jgi:competence protein ComEC